MRHGRSFWVVLSLCAASLALAQATAQSPSGEDPVHAELRKLQAEMEQAVNEGNLDGLLAHVDDTIVFTAMNAHTAYGKQGIRDYFARMMEGEKRVVQSVKMDFIPDKLVEFYGADVAVSAGKADSHYVLTNGMDFEVPARWTATLVRREGRWLVASFHYSTNMFKNPVLDAQRKWLIIAGTGAALVLGIVGFLFGRRGRVRH